MLDFRSVGLVDVVNPNKVNNHDDQQETEDVVDDPIEDQGGRVDRFGWVSRVSRHVFREFIDEENHENAGKPDDHQDKEDFEGKGYVFREFLDEVNHENAGQHQEYQEKQYLVNDGHIIVGIVEEDKNVVKFIEQKVTNCNGVANPSWKRANRKRNYKEE